MLSQPNVHWLAINKLDLLTAHNRCLRIITQMCCSTFLLPRCRSRFEREGAGKDYTRKKQATILPTG
jgi:hypothetical protein